MNQRRTLPVSHGAQRLASCPMPQAATTGVSVSTAAAATAKTAAEQMRPRTETTETVNSLSSSVRRQHQCEDRTEPVRTSAWAEPRRGPQPVVPGPQRSPPLSSRGLGPPQQRPLTTHTVPARASLGGAGGRPGAVEEAVRAVQVSQAQTSGQGTAAASSVRGSPEERRRRRSSDRGAAASPEARPKPSAAKPSAAEQRRTMDRLSKGRCGDPRYTALMRRLNESASWLSDVSGACSEDDIPDAVAAEGGEGQAPEATTPGLAIDTRRLCLAEMLNESATFLDESESGGSEGDQEEVPQPPPTTGPAAIAARAGFLEEGYGYGPSPVVSAGVARSFSC